MDEKTQIGVKIDVSVWKAVRVKSIQDGIAAGDIVNAAIRQYMGMDADTPAPPASSPKPTRQPATPATDQTEAHRIIKENDEMDARQLAELLNEAGHTTARGREWTQNTVNKTRNKIRKGGMV